MDKNSKSSKPMSLCERLFRAIKVSPSFRRFGHRSSLQSSNFAPQPLQVHHSPAAAPKRSNPVELELDGSSPDSTPMKQYKINSNGYAKKPKPKTDMAQIAPAHSQHNVVSKHGTGGSEENNHNHINERFDEFINRARLKIRTVSNAGAGKVGPARIDSVNDKASNFINQTKMRIRTTSSNLGSGVYK